MQEYKIIPDVNALAYQRKRIATNDTKHCILDKQLTELKKREEKVIETLTEHQSSLKSVKDQIDKLKVEHESLVEKRENVNNFMCILTHRKKRFRMSEEIICMTLVRKYTGYSYCSIAVKILCKFCQQTALMLEMKVFYRLKTHSTLIRCLQRDKVLQH